MRVFDAVVFPACAGMNRGQRQGQRLGQRVPRLRGDEPQSVSRCRP
ncbi:hypothetical protein GbCGDNIH6_8258 [Granulibacter bethesdensis]|nr:hypothetical protein GbCGDNIH6_8258 [Granulibacter bethesdensis]